MTGFEGATWKKSSRSGEEGSNCVEVAGGPGAVGVRDTKHRDLGHLVLAPSAWAGLLGAVKDGRIS